MGLHTSDMRIQTSLSGKARARFDSSFSPASSISLQIYTSFYSSDIKSTFMYKYLVLVDKRLSYFDFVI